MWSGERNMRFTKYNSLQNIMDYPQMDRYLKVFYSQYLLDMYPEDMKELPIALVEQRAKTPWEEPFSIVADQLLDAVNLVMDLLENHTRKAISLWEAQESDLEEQWDLTKEEKGGKEKVFLIAPTEKGMEEKRPAVIICPGGGYEEVCFSGEGTPVMHYMEAQGYCPFILRYRTRCDGVYPAPQQDLALAVKYVREHAVEYGINVNNVLVMGFSAGGHLCASEAAMCRDAESRPDKICLSYPVISFVHEPHEGSAAALTGGDETLREQLSAENLITADYPPTFVWTCADDDCVPPSNAMRMGKALEEAGVRHELHVYGSGGHGCALAFSKEASGWSRAMIEFCGN